MKSLYEKRALRESPQCKYPFCNSKKSGKLENKYGQRPIKQYEKEETKQNTKKVTKKSTHFAEPEAVTSNLNMASPVRETGGGLEWLAQLKLLVPKINMPQFSFPTPENIQSVLFDIVGMASFIIMASVMFWFTITQYLWHFLKILSQAQKRTKLIVLSLLLLLFISITIHAVRGRHHHSAHNASTKKPPKDSSVKPSKVKSCPICQQKSCAHLSCPEKSSKENILTPKNNNNKRVIGGKCPYMKSKRLNSRSANIKKGPSCNCLNKKMAAPKKSDCALSDKEAREMYNRYKFFSSPCEMKSPPTISSILEISLGYYNRMLGLLSPF